MKLNKMIYNIINKSPCFTKYTKNLKDSAKKYLSDNNDNKLVNKTMLTKKEFEEFF